MFKKLLYILLLATPLIFSQATYKYWKWTELTVSQVNTDYLGILEIELIDTNGVNLATSIGGTVTGTFDFNERAFDGSYASGDGAVTPGAVPDYTAWKYWVQMEFATPQTIESYIVSSFQSTTKTEQRSASRWILTASNDGINYDFIDFQQKQIGWTFAEKRSFPLVSDSLGRDINTLFSLSPNVHYSGTGTSDDPFLIYDIFDWDSVKSTSGQFYVKLMGDLDGTLYGHGMTYQNPTYCIFDGNGHTIKNFNFYTTINSTFFQSLSLFMSYLGDVNGMNRPGVLQNVHFYNMSIEDYSGYAGYRSIGLIAYATHGSSRIENVTVRKCTVIIGASIGSLLYDGAIGILVGQTYATGPTIKKVSVDSCYMKMLNGQSMGAIVGINSTLSNYNYELVSKNNTFVLATTGANDHNIGGLFGVHKPLGAGSIYDSYAFQNTFYDSSSSATINYFGGVTGRGSNRMQAGESDTRIYVARDSLFNAGAVSYYGAYYGKIDSTDLITTMRLEYIYGDSATINTDSMIYFGKSDPHVEITEVDFKSTAEMKNISTYTTWDFESSDPTWSIQSNTQLGYPFLTWENLSPTTSLNILTPTVETVFTENDTIPISFTSAEIDTLFLFYSNDNKFSWVPFDTLLITAEPTDTTFYYWFDTGLNGDVYLSLRNSTGFEEESARFYIYGLATITILSPIDSSATIPADTKIPIVVETRNIKQFSLFYAINDTTNWIPIVLDLPVENVLDTTTYMWPLPSIFGQIFLLAREIADTTIYIQESTLANIGVDKPSQPAICWYVTRYFRDPIPYAQYGNVEVNWFVDQACGWSAGHQGYKVNSLLNDNGTAYQFTYRFPERGEFPSVREFLEDPYIGGGFFQYTATDTTFLRWNTFYDIGYDSLIYKNRLYFIDFSDTTLRVKDMINNIDSMLYVDLKPLSTFDGWWHQGWSEIPRLLQIYNVQRSKLDSMYYPSNQDYESLNDESFVPKLLIKGSRYGGGALAKYAVLLGEPVSPIYAQDIARVFQSLAYTRDYFRGIDPKARKKGR